MNDESSSLASPVASRAWIGLAIAILIYIVSRYPMVVHAAGQMDEQWFAVPGLTVYREGIPRIPYCPTRRRETFFENADKCLFALPPGLHYVQAPFFAIFAPSYATARLPVFLGGIIALILLWRLAIKVIPSAWTIGIGLILVAVSRPTLFTAVTARPDLLCCVCGWGSILALWRWHDQLRLRWLVIGGALCGLGLLFHPFALVACLQCGVWTLSRRGTLLERLGRASLLTFCALIVFSLWLPLILRFPHEFQSQFTSNVLERSGPGVWQRLLWPWASIAHHWKYQLEFNLPIQFSMIVVGLVVGTIAWIRCRWDAHHRRYLLLVWSGCYLTATVAGIHPTKGYWVYPIAMIYPLAVDGVMLILQTLRHRMTSRGSAETRSDLRTTFADQVGFAIASILLCLMMIPGSGIRTSITYLTHWGDERYHARRFISRVLEKLPREGLFMADVNYVFDVYLSGRKTILMQPRQRFWGDETPQIDYLLIGQEGIDFKAPQDYDTVMLRREGARDTEQECFVDIYVPKANAEK